MHKLWRAKILVRTALVIVVVTLLLFAFVIPIKTYAGPNTVHNELCPGGADTVKPPLTQTSFHVLKGEVSTYDKMKPIYDKHLEMYLGCSHSNVKLKLYL